MVHAFEGRFPVGHYGDYSAHPGQHRQAHEPGRRHFDEKEIFSLVKRRNW